MKTIRSVITTHPARSRRENEEDMYGVSVTLVGNKKGVYIDPTNCNACVDYTLAVNYKDVNMFGVNNLAIERTEDGTMRIFQAGGYNRIRGLFCDLY